MKMELGVQIDIQRSDGRVHPATISGIDGLNVTVEWFEFGETKGKEINLDQVYSLNPALQPKSQIKQPPPSRRQSVPQNNAVNNVKDVRKKVASPAPRSRSLRSKSMIPPPNAAKNSKIAYMPKNDVTVSHDDTVLHQQRPAEKENSKPSTVSQSTRDRRSNCVKEVERLKKNREDRRARQTEIKKEQIKVQAEIDPGNPNWHFLKMIRDYEQSLGDHEAITMHDPVVDHQICVCVRKRPINKKEINKKDIDIITPVDREHIVVHECKLKVDLTKYLDNQKFRFDYSFDENATNELVYRYTAKPLVETIFNGGMATCFAYGQTGSGKTHTMGGDFTSTKQQDCSKGIYALAATDIFKLQKSKYKHLDLIVSASFFEIYSGKVFDLMNKRKKLRVLEDGKAQVQIPELAENVVTCLEDVLKVLDTGLKTRTSGVTSANQNSSRSHAIFQLVLRKRGHGKDGSMGSLHGKFSLIDLAGNERGADTISADRQTRREGAEINKSLLALKECIRALGRKGAHLPFRASKLTQVLRDSFIGETSKTCMIAMISPCMSCSENTLNTLRYADRVKELRCDEVSSKEKKVLNLDYPDEVEEEPPANLSNSNHQYRNPELAMLCTKSSREMLKSSVDPDCKDKKSDDQEETRHNSDDLYNFHEAVSLLMESEEQVIDEHKSSMEENYNYLEEEKKLLERIENDVDCDVEEYVHRLDLILMEKIDKFTALREKVSQFKEQLFEEEKASKNVRRLPFV